MLGDTVSHYKILEKLGQGGMGEVYLAEDTRLGRKVALKFLAPELTRDHESLIRFRNEARAVAELSHPNIATIHDIDEVDGRPFLVLEHLQGQTLSARIKRSPLAIEEVLRIGVALAAGLAEAHSRGILHRDIKSANVMLTEKDEIKILDFGLAHRRDATQLTRPGAMMGTVGYMSPEQARGETVGEHADVWSLGVVLYECLTGRLPFTGEATAVVHQIATAEPTPPSAIRTGVPLDLERAVLRCLEKEPQLRYQSMADLRADLLRHGRNTKVHQSQGEFWSSTGGNLHTVVVLPFKMLAGGAEYEFLGLALAEAVSHALSPNDELAVRPTSAVAEYAAKDAVPLQVARKLSAGTVVEGSIQRLGDVVRVQVQVWDAISGSTRHSVKLDGRLDDLFSLQDRVAEQLAIELGLGSSSVAMPTPNPRAYEQYLRASERLLRWSHVDTERAIEMLRSAVELDPDFSDGWGRLSGALVSMGALFDPSAHWFAEADSTIERALALDPTNPEAWTARARWLWTPEVGFRHEEALSHFGRACRHPSCPADAPLWQAVVLSHCGLHTEAVSVLTEALRANPDDLLALLTLGETRGWMGELEAFEEHVDKVIFRDPSFPYGHLFRPTALIYQDKFEQAEEALRSAKGVLGDDSMLLASEGLLWAKLGETERARQAVNAATAQQRSVSHAHHTYHYLAAARATLGELQQAVQELERAERAGLPNHPAFANDPHFAVLYGREDFEATMKRLRASSRVLADVYARSRSSQTSA